MNNLSCDIIQDLMPLYYDGVCSTATREAVEAHIASCADCKSMLNTMSAPLELPLEAIEKNRDSSAALSSIRASWKRSKAASFTKGLIWATLVCSVLYLSYLGLSQWNITNVPTAVIQITDVSRLNDGKIAYHVRMTDGYNVNQINFNYDQSGNFYMTPVRPILKSKKFAEIGLANRYDSVDLKQVYGNQKNPDKPEINAVYYGTPKDRILIWKKGMELPAASEAIEAQFVNPD